MEIEFDSKPIGGLSQENCCTKILSCCVESGCNKQEWEQGNVLNV